MLVGAVKRVFTSGPGGPPGATLAAALQDVVAGVKAVLTAPDLASARAALGLGNVANLAPADLPVSSAAAAAIAARLLASSNLADLASVSAARTNLGLAIGANVQAWDADLDALAALATQAFGRSLLTGADAGSVRALLGLGSAALLAAGQPGGAATLDGSTGKLASAQIPDSLLGALRYQGGWNAATNSPALPTPSAANKGFYFIVLTAGTTSLTGPSGAIADWQVGDWAVSDGTYWEKVDSSDQVISVAGLQGAITAAALKGALAIGSADITDATSLGRTLLTGVSAAAVLAAIGGAARGGNTDITSLGGLTTPLSAAQGGTGYGSLSAALDGVFGATRGTILVRTASGWAALPLGTNGYTLQSNGSDLVYAASTPGTGALRYDTLQSLAAADQDRVRVNVLSAILSAVSATTTLAATDFDRPINATGTITLTVPNGGPGWRTGPLVNRNAVTGLVTLAVPSGATLDGVANGTTVLFPGTATRTGQRARIVQTGSAAYITEWIDPTPILATVAVASGSAVAAIDLPLPAGYSKFEIEFRDLTNATAGVFARYRLTDDGFATVKSGSTDYTNLYLLTYSTTVASNGPAADYGIISANIARQNSGDPAMSGTIKISPGGSIAPAANNRPAILTEAAYVNGNTPAYEVDKVWTTCASITTRANGIRIYASSGNISGAFTLKGIP